MSITSSDSHDKSLEMSSKNEEDDERNFPQDLTTTASSLIRNCIEGRQSSEETDSASYKSSKSRSHSSLTSSYHESPKESSEKVADCAGCGQGIRDRYYLFAVDQNWHVSCLKCHSCHVSLDSEVSCFTKEGKIFCKQDYFRQFAVKRCSRCGQGIYTTDVVMKIREDNVYHLTCFTCCWCNIPLSQGDYFGMNGNLVYCRTHFIMRVFEMSQNKPFHPNSRGHQLFRHSEHNLFPTTDSCQNHLRHQRRCDSPNHHRSPHDLHPLESLGEQTPSMMMPLQGMAGVAQNLPHDMTLLAKESEVNEQNENCSDQTRIPTAIAVNRSHLSSSSPSNNQSSLITTDLSQEAKEHVKSSPVKGTSRKGRPRKRKILPVTEDLSSQRHHEEEEERRRADVFSMNSSSSDQRQQTQQNPSHPHHHQLENNMTGGLSGQTSNLASCEGSSLGMYIPSDGSGSSGPSSFTGSSGRAKRMRTSFKHHQLRTMKQYFAINQNPDAKDLKALAQKTNLSKRVLQVWFQNARAKWRRNNLRLQGVHDPHLDNNNNNNNNNSHHSNKPQLMTLSSSLDSLTRFSSALLIPDSTKTLLHSLENNNTTSSCPVVMSSSHELSCSPEGSSTRPFSSPSASPNIHSVSNIINSNGEEFNAMTSPLSSSPHHHHNQMHHHHPSHAFHSSMSHLHAFQHPMEYPDSI